MLSFMKFQLQFFKIIFWSLKPADSTNVSLIANFQTRKKYNTATLSSERKLFFISMTFFLFLLSNYLICDVIFKYIFHLHGDFQIFLLYYAINAVWILGCAMNPLIYYHSMKYTISISILILIYQLLFANLQFNFIKV